MNTKLIPLKVLSAGPKSLSVFTNKKHRNLAFLQQSIEKDGLLYPLVVIKEGAKYIVIDGKKRLSVIKRLAKSKLHNRSTAKVPCIVQEANKIIPLATNRPLLLSEPELAHEIIIAAQSRVSCALIAQRFECDISVVEDCISLTKLHPEMLLHFNNKAISLDQAAAFATIDNMTAQLDLLHQLGPFASDVEIIAAIKSGATVIELSEDNIIILPSRGQPPARNSKQQAEFGNACLEDTLNGRIAA